MKSQGFSLVEMVIVVAILGIALGLGIPSYTQWIRNVQIRNHAESMQTGLMKARNEALRRNLIVSFWLVKSPNPDVLANDCTLYADADADSKGISWLVSIESPHNLCASAISDTASPFFLAKHAAGNGGDQATTNTGPAAANVVRFNGLGQVITSLADTITSINIAGFNPTSEDKNYRITINSGGMIKLCDPTITVTTDSRFCS